MTFTHKNLMTVCCAAVLAFGLAACGSSSDDDNVPVTTGGDTNGGDTNGGDTNGGDTNGGDDATAGLTPEEMAAKAAAATKAAATKAEAIGDEFEQMADAGLGGSDAPPDAEDAGAYSLSIERDRDGTTVEISLANAMDDAAEFMPGDDLDGGRTMLVLTMPENDDGEVVKEVVIVKTDIDEPAATLFEMVRNPAGEPTQELDVSTNMMNDGGPGLDDDTFEALMVGTGDITNVKSDAFTAGTGATLNFFRAQGATGEVPAVEAFETAGTYNGADGTYRCNDDGADCTVEIDAKGAITAITGDWIFTPDPGAKSYVADAEYLSYGFWLKNTTKDDATTYNEVQTFANAEGFADTDGNTLNVVTGTAMYKGGSVGVYVKNVLDVQANIVSATSGHFSANVELNANFGGGDVKDNNQFTIGGMITGFVLQHGEVNDWEVTLGLADFSGGRVGEGAPGESAPGISERTITFNDVAQGDSTAAPGSWNGMFHGPAGDIDDVNTKPAAVTGEFNANFTDGTAAGGFGANIKK